jgi:hypothetical protein
LPQLATHGTVVGIGGRATVFAKVSKASGRQKKQFLTSIDPEVIRDIKVAAMARDKTASEVMEMAA